MKLEGRGGLGRMAFSLQRAAPLFFLQNLFPIQQAPGSALPWVGTCLARTSTSYSCGKPAGPWGCPSRSCVRGPGVGGAAWRWRSQASEKQALRAASLGGRLAVPAAGADMV